MRSANRREFLSSSTALATAATIAPWMFTAATAQETSVQELSVGIIGTGRGMVRRPGRLHPGAAV